jgi:hypothetical protein
VKGQAVAGSDGNLLPSIFAALFGGFLGLTFLKFGNPPILEKFVSTPKQSYDYVFGFPWPIAWCLHAGGQPPPSGS